MEHDMEENSSSEPDEDAEGAMEAPAVEKPRRKRRKRRNIGCRSKKSIPDHARVNHRYIAANPVLAAEVQRKKAAVSQFCDEKKEDDDGGSPPRRNPGRAASQNAAFVQEEDDPNDMLIRKVDVSCFEDVARGKLDDELHVHRTDKLGRNIATHETRRARRMGIFCLFSTVHQCTPESSGLWDGKKGIAVAIRNRLCLPDACDARKIKNVMRLVLTCRSKNIMHTGVAEPRKEWEHHLIQTKSHQAQLIADLTENGFGFSNTTFFVNLCREENDLPHVGRSTTCEVVKRLKPRIATIRKRAQGSFDINSGWCRANHRWALQQLIVHRRIETQDIPKKFLNPDGTLPKCFNEDHLRHIDALNIDHWDETHEKVRIGRCKTVKGGKQLDCRFLRDLEGGLDDEGEHDPRSTEFNMKCEKEARFCTGCAIGMDAAGEPLTDADGNCVGVALPIFECSKTTIVSNKDCMRAFKSVIHEARVASETSEWVVTDRADNTICQNDPLKQIKNEKGTIVLPLNVREKLLADGVFAVGDLRDKFQNRPTVWRNFCKHAAGTGEERFLKALNAAKECEPGEPRVIDYRTAPNPCCARCGGEDWQSKVCASPQMKASTNVQDLVTHIVTAGTERRKGTKHEDEWCFYHDALSLMTSNETMEWMERKKWLKHWILPQHDLNGHIPCCQNPRPIGNNMPGQPWDEALNKDHDDVVLRHVAATSLLANDDPRKFSLATPNLCSAACRRVHQGVPSERIAHDMFKTLDCWQMVFENDGLNRKKNANGQRGDEGRALGVAKRVGARVKTQKKDLKTHWCHEDAKTAMVEFVNRSKEQFKQTLSKVRKEHRNTSVMDDSALDPELHEIEKDANDQEITTSIDDPDAMPSDTDCSSDEEQHTASSTKLLTTAFRTFSTAAHPS